MLRALPLLLLLGAPPKAEKADSLAKARQWEELYLAFAAADPKGYSGAEQKSVGKALQKGCDALLKSDAVMAYSLGEKAAQFDPTADALLCLGRSGSRTDQKTAAEQALKQGEAGYPSDARFPLELGKLALSEKDGRTAVAALERVPKKSKEAKEADGLLKQARAIKGDQDSAREEANAQARDLRKQEEAAASGEKRAPPPQAMAGNPAKHRVDTTDSLSYESAVDSEGRRVRQNAHFRFRYFNGQKDFGQRADYEGSVQAALEEARNASHRIIGQTRESATDVILYSKAEFEMHHGKGMAQAIAGFYSDNAIRMNDSAEINDHNQAVLVHEYTHAVIDEMSGFHDERVPIWVNEGLAEAPHREGVLLPACGGDDLPLPVEAVEADVAQRSLRHEELDEELTARRRRLVGHHLRCRRHREARRVEHGDLHRRRARAAGLEGAADFHLGDVRLRRGQRAQLERLGARRVFGATDHAQHRHRQQRRRTSHCRTILQIRIVALDKTAPRGRWRRILPGALGSKHQLASDIR